jgi:hypothetical protein
MSAKYRKRLQRARNSDDYQKRKRAEHLQQAYELMGHNNCGICLRKVEGKSQTLCVDPQTNRTREYVAVICKSCAMRWTPLQLHNTQNYESVLQHVNSFVDSGIKSWARYKLQNLPFERAQKLAKWLNSLPITITTPRINPLAKDYKRRIRNKCKRLFSIGLPQEIILHD